MKKVCECCGKEFNAFLSWDTKCYKCEKLERLKKIQDDINEADFCENENENHSEVDEFRCSSCGLHLEDWARIEEECRYEYTLKFCPGCGRKVR